MFIKNTGLAKVSFGFSSLFAYGQVCEGPRFDSEQSKQKFPSTSLLEKDFSFAKRRHLYVPLLQTTGLLKHTSAYRQICLKFQIVEKIQQANSP